MKLLDILKERSVEDTNVYRVAKMSDLLGRFGLDIPDVLPIAVVIGPYGIFHREIQDDVRNIVGGDFYILPSSIWELICIGKNAGFHPKELCHMVREINSSVVNEEDRLSDNIFEIVNKEIVTVGDKNG